MPALRRDDLAQRMYDRYCQGLTYSQVAAEFGRTGAVPWKMFKRRGWSTRVQPRDSHIWHRGRYYSLMESTGYLRATDGDRELLHRVVWQEHNGMALQSGWDVHHIDHNKLNNDPSNLEALTKSQHTTKHVRERAAAKARLLKEVA